MSTDRQSDSIEATAATIVSWASMKPPMPRSEFLSRVKQLLGEIVPELRRKRRLTDRQREQILEAMRSAERTGKNRKRGLAEAIASQHGVTREYLYQLLKRDRAAQP